MAFNSAAGFAVECPAIFVPVRKIRNWHERSLRWHEASGINRSR
jgi:hypothetical protein